MLFKVCCSLLINKFEAKRAVNSPGDWKKDQIQNKGRIIFKLLDVYSSWAVIRISYCFQLISLELINN
jgi:hypothetical protein